MQKSTFVPRTFDRAQSRASGRGKIKNSRTARYRHFTFCISNFASRYERAAFTLIETVVAVAVISAAVVGPFALATRGIASASLSKNRLVAANLAQEGIELVRAVRDNNVLCDSLDGAVDGSWEWDRDPDGSGQFRNRNKIGVAWDRRTTISCSGSTVVSPLLDANSCEDSNLRLDPATGLYGYDLGDPETAFQRCVDIDQPGGPEDGINPTEMMDVTVAVTWNERGVARTVELTERMYNWR
ncbi:MAG: hypothetical protein A3B37_01610 [Candidatus Sungbacteria bacterium RIFCSPLOWO2_01_FULL_59_16]|uniref:Uncharacterized protein n=1 Tax=Candidatus Sungbacteria bacterium RIFCSPLOWO2_01_FULL_59_16 TaxID=1802280 RepID=A0A1G2LC61_9BACT|nr:MAG: hypothetical protein A3B37_01610 [Candidatus Sungbacteria bacterium RIFCSPLOWO2_01_FULL_59_16]